MTAYAIFLRDRTVDPGELARYRAMAPAAREGREVEPLAFYGDVEALEGPEVEGVVILRFPDMAAAREWYDSSPYREAMRHRRIGADYRVILVEGLEGT